MSRVLQRATATVALIASVAFATTLLAVGLGYLSAVGGVSLLALLLTRPAKRATRNNLVGES